MYSAYNQTSEQCFSHALILACTYYIRIYILALSFVSKIPAELWQKIILLFWLLAIHWLGINTKTIIHLHFCQIYIFDIYDYKRPGVNSIKKYKCTLQVGPLFLQIHTNLNPLKVPLEASNLYLQWYSIGFNQL